MKLVSNFFNKINLISISIIIIFTIIGVSYCAWNDMLIFNYDFKSGRLEIDNEEYKYDINLNNNCNNLSIPFIIINRSTVPLKEKKILCSIDDKDITDVCNIVFDEYENNEIKGKIVLDSNKINEIIIKEEGIDYSLITEPISIKRMLSIEIEFMQSNIDENGWNDTVNFNIYINKTINPIIQAVVPVIITEVAPEVAPIIIPEVEPEVVLELVPETVSILNIENKVQEADLEKIGIKKPKLNEQQNDENISLEPELNEQQNDEDISLEPELNEQQNDESISLEPELNEQQNDENITIGSELNEPKIVEDENYDVPSTEEDKNLENTSQ